jgi:hypothetical protein
MNYLDELRLQRVKILEVELTLQFKHCLNDQLIYVNVFEVFTPIKMWNVIF